MFVQQRRRLKRSCHSPLSPLSDSLYLSSSLFPSLFCHVVAAIFTAFPHRGILVGLFHPRVLCLALFSIVFAVPLPAGQIRRLSELSACVWRRALKGICYTSFYKSLDWPPQVSTAVVLIIKLLIERQVSEYVLQAMKAHMKAHTESCCWEKPSFSGPVASATCHLYCCRGIQKTKHLDCDRSPLVTSFFLLGILKFCATENM